MDRNKRAGRKSRTPSCAVVAPLHRKSGSVVDVVDVDRRYRTAESRRVRVGRDTGRLRIGGRKRSPAQSPGRGVALSKFFARGTSAPLRERVTRCRQQRRAPPGVFAVLGKVRSAWQATAALSFCTALSPHALRRVLYVRFLRRARGCAAS